LRALPGVEAAGAVSRLPLSSSELSAPFSVDGVETPPEQRPVALYQTATDGYFEAMAIPLLAGRPFGSGEKAALPTAIVSEALALKMFGGQALGRRIRLGLPGAQGPWRTIVGVVGNVRHRDLADGRVAVYVPLAQDARREMAFVLRGSVSPASLGPPARAVLFALDPEQPVSQLEPLQSVLDDNVLLTPSYAAGVLGVFALLALLLSATGVYGVMAVAVSQREQEMGIRMALGAQPRDVWRLVLSQGLRPAVGGVLAGAAAALLSGRVLESFLYGVASRDLLTVGGVCLFLLAVAAAATWFPARRATRVDPMIALRAE